MSFTPSINKHSLNTSSVLDCRDESDRVLVLEAHSLLWGGCVWVTLMYKPNQHNVFGMMNEGIHKLRK